MLEYNDLKRLQDANKLLNKKYTELGLSPLKPVENSGSLEEFVQETYLDLSKELESEHLNELSPEESQDIESLLIDESYTDSKKDTKAEFFEENRYILLKKFAIPLVLLIVFVFVISSDFRKASDNTNTEGQNSDSYSFAKEKQSKNPIKIINIIDEPYIITSGTYQTRAEAKKAKLELAKIAGTSLKVTQTEGYYTIQIGPSYKSFDNASLVFKELTKYPIKALSIKAR